jgi:hypothetical protein
MARSGFNEPIEPMDLANMRANGVRSLLIWCRNCHYEKIMNVDHLPGNVTVPSLGQRMSCIKCGGVGYDLQSGHWVFGLAADVGSPTSRLPAKASGLD